MTPELFRQCVLNTHGAVTSLGRRLYGLASACKDQGNLKVATLLLLEAKAVLASAERIRVMFAREEQTDPTVQKIWERMSDGDLPVKPEETPW